MGGEFLYKKYYEKRLDVSIARPRNILSCGGFGIFQIFLNGYIINKEFSPAKKVASIKRL